MEKTENISDVIENFRDAIYGENDALFDRNGNNVSRQVEDTIRSQIEQLLGRIDTKKRGGNPEFETNQDFGYNQKSSEIAKQIKDLII